MNVRTHVGPGLVVPVPPARGVKRRRLGLLGALALLGVGAGALLVALPWLGLAPASAADQGGLLQVEHPGPVAAAGLATVLIAGALIVRLRRSGRAAGA